MFSITQTHTHIHTFLYENRIHVLPRISYQEIHDEYGHEDDEDDQYNMGGDWVENYTCEVNRRNRLVGVVKVMEDGS